MRGRSGPERLSYRGRIASQPPATADVQVTVGDAKTATITGVDLDDPRTGTGAR
jgi:hypothetical protein